MSLIHYPSSPRVELSIWKILNPQTAQRAFLSECECMSVHVFTAFDEQEAACEVFAPGQFDGF